MHGARLLCMKRGRGPRESEVLGGVRFSLLLLPLFDTSDKTVMAA